MMAPRARFAPLNDVCVDSSGPRFGYDSLGSARRLIWYRFHFLAPAFFDCFFAGSGEKSASSKSAKYRLCGEPSGF